MPLECNLTEGFGCQAMLMRLKKSLPILFNMNDNDVKGNPGYLAIFKNGKIDPDRDDNMPPFTPPAGAQNIEINKSANSATVE